MATIKRNQVEASFVKSLKEKDQRIAALEAENSRLQELHLKRTRLTEKLQARLDAVDGLPPDRLLDNGDYYILHSKIKAALEKTDV